MAVAAAVAKHPRSVVLICLRVLAQVNLGFLVAWKRVTIMILRASASVEPSTVSNIVISFLLHAALNTTI